MTAYILLYILLVHWVADFVLQSHEEANRKSESFEWLCRHTLKYSVVWFFSMIMFIATTGINLGFDQLVYFTAVTFVAHTITDFFTSKMTRYYFKIKHNYHNGFVVVGFDQMLHYVQLYLTFQYFLL